MVRRSVLKVSRCLDSCHICSAWRSLTPSLPTAGVHGGPRRQFNSTSGLSRPPAAAEAVAEQYDDGPHTGSVQASRPAFGRPGVGGRAGGVFGGAFGGGFGGGFNTSSIPIENGLTVEETKQRDALRKQRAAQQQVARDGGSSTRTTTPAPTQSKIRYGDFGWNSSWSTHAENSGRGGEERERRNVIGRNQEKQPGNSPRITRTNGYNAAPPLRDHKGGSWNCRVCRNVNPAPRKVCPRCGTPETQPSSFTSTLPTGVTNGGRGSVNPRDQVREAPIVRRVNISTSYGGGTISTTPNNTLDAFSGFRKGKWSQEQQEKEEYIASQLSKSAPPKEHRKPEVDEVLALEVDPQAEAEASVDSKSKKIKKKGRRRDENDDEGGASVSRVSNDLDYNRELERAERRRLKELKKQHAKAAKKEIEAPAPIYLPEFITVGNLADVLGVRPADFLGRLVDFGFEEATYSHILDAETAGLIASEFNFTPIIDNAGDDLVAAPPPQDTSNLSPRPPVVTIMGHVDHGKTTLLDWLRKSSVVATEHGGITQHIGAFSVTMPSGKVITFLDTPGHAAFLDMRRRGANVTDIVILVVAADDSVKPQTIEAIKHAKEANVPIIVAINKIDKPDINVERVKQDLARNNVHVEDIGGDVQAICVSGKTGQGMLDLEEATVTLSEMLDHRAERDGNVEGWVIEATTKKGGRVATVLIKRGTLKPGDVVVAGTTWAKVRTLKNEAGVIIQEALPGTPVEVDGWKEQPQAGNEVLEATSEQHAKSVIEYRLTRVESKKLSEDIGAINKAKRADLERRRQELQAEEDERAQSAADADSGPKGVPFLIKADVSGSVEALVNSVSALGNSEVYARILRSGVGPISEFDIQHAAVAKGHIITFNTPVDPSMARMAEAEGVKIMNHNIIYELIDDVKSKLSDHLLPTITQHVTGEAEIGQIFEISGKGRTKIAIAGSRVRNGLISRSHKARVLRDKEVIYDGIITSLKNVKKDVTEMRKGTECGIAFENWNDFRVGDHVQCYEEKSEKRML
ncbi:mitochondrial initiation factor 2 [Histoplasma capsulatum var. duboisii H88]|uniref:Translation initiation factor IF-2, mitochondrial n=2 Tax=Ajellomyces capsulatus TaxID=5037 RepID=F0U644_AJEC8|nr:mitochondrial initiation factor 2 [Histoplasma capsulatum H143]EGC42227.1 mitochondrial initiation factor 2 [Histoplasma capsulatum var. duboisii H88]QSS51357.1 mitochondrial initiation factor 2 [Histoplasma capsulatum var. duboisii H88]